MEKVIGKNGTIFSPSASMNLINSEIVFDLKNTPSYKMGPLAEMIRKNLNLEAYIHIGLFVVMVKTQIF